MLGTLICVSACLVVVALIMLAGSLYPKNPKNRQQRRAKLWRRRHGSLLFGLVFTGWFVYMLTFREAWTRVSGAIAVFMFAFMLYGLYSFLRTLPLQKWWYSLKDSVRSNRLFS